MGFDSPLPRRAADSDDCADVRLSEVRHVTSDILSEMTSYEYFVDPRAPSLLVEHDKQKRLFVLTWPDGKTERFRDNPARHLVVEPDPETGELRPAIKRGRPAYMYLCREEREVH